MTNIALVTGGSGFVGGRLITRLIAKGWQVHALARSESSRKIVIALGAQAFEGDLNDKAALQAAVAGCNVVFHVAALFSLWATDEEFERSNVEATKLLVDVAKQSGTVQRFIQVGASAVVMGDIAPMLNVNETLAVQQRKWAPYSASKARSETIVLSANQSGIFETMVIRPPMIWGKGMPMLNDMIEQVRKGQFRWIDHGTQMMSTAHVDNVCHAVELAFEHGRGGEAYFISDQEDKTSKQVLSDLLQTQGVQPPTSSIPLALIWFMAKMMEWIWHSFKLQSAPPITRQMLRLIGASFTLDVTKAQQEINYHPEISWQQGLADMHLNHLSDSTQR